MKELLKQPSTYIGIVSILTAVGIVSEDQAQVLSNTLPVVVEHATALVASVIGLVGAYLTVKNIK